MAELLFVDWDELSLEVFRAVALHYRERGHRVRIETDGNTASAAIAEKVPEILVLRMMLRYRDGFAILDQLRNSERGQRTAVIFISTLNEHGRPTRLPDAPMTDYVFAGFSRWQLVLTIDGWLERLGLLDPVGLASD